MLKVIEREARRLFRSWKYFPKLSDYIIFTSLSIIAGYTFTKHSVTFLHALQLVLFLPTIYATFYLFIVLYHTLLKSVISLFKVKYQNVDYNVVANIADSHALLALMLIVYFVCRIYFSIENGLELNSTALSLAYLCAFLFFIRRVIRRRSPCHTREHECNLFSLLKYDAYKHIHMTSATIVAIPFLFGISLAKHPYELTAIIANSAVAYIVYLLTWMVLYQYKYKSQYMLKRQLLYFPSIFYPAYPIFFSMYVKTNNYLFYTVFVLVGIMYAMPVIHRTRFKLCPIVRWFFNEKYMLIVVYLIVIYFSLSKSGGVNLNSSVFNINLTTVVVSFVGVILGSSFIFDGRYLKNLKRDKEEVMYITLPVFVLLLAHIVAYVLYKLTIAGNIHIFTEANLCFLSDQLNASENIFLFAFASYAAFLYFTTKHNVSGAQPSNTPEN